MTITLKAQKRGVQKKDRTALRKAGMVLGVLYGKKEVATPIAVSVIDFKKVWEEAGESTVVTITGLDGDKDVLISDVAVDPLLDTPVHIDFYAIEAGKPVEVEVGLVFVGESPAEKLLGGNLMKIIHEITVEALPKDLPHDIEVDVTTLATFEDQIFVKDIKLPKGVTAITDAEEVVAFVTAQRAEEVEEVVEAPDLSTIEVEKKGKKEEEGESEEADKKE